MATQITIVAGSQETMAEDIRIISSEMVECPVIAMAHDKDTKALVTEKVSSLFLPPNSVIVLVDPHRETLEGLTSHFAALEGKVPIIVYYTGDPPQPYPLKGKLVVMEKERARRLEDRALKMLKRNNKVMTDKAFAALSAMIRDESSLDSELMKIINFVGERKRIESKDVKLLTADRHDETFLDLFQALADEDRKRVVETFEGLVLQGTPLLWIHGFLLRQVRLLLQGKDVEELLGPRSDYALFQKAFTKWKGSLSSKSMEKKHYLPYQKPYYAFKLTQTSRKMSSPALIALFHRLVLFDRRVKSGTKLELPDLEQALFKR
jgi:hypothetical protein